MTFLPSNSRAAYLPTSEVFPSDPSQLLIKLTQVQTDTANSVNIREIGQYEDVEVLAGKQFFTVGDAQKKRSVYRKVFAFTNIATGATLNIAHGLTNITRYTNIYGTCITEVVDYRPIPYVSTVAVNEQISITVTATNIVIVVGAGTPNVTSGFAILEYLRT